MPLKYYPEHKPGYMRKRCGRGFYYVFRGRKIADPKKLAWIDSLRIPPAWNDVWITTHKDNHLLATGIDAKGRKQYRYHAEWSMHQNEKKFDRMFDFGMTLPKIRTEIEKHICCKGLTKEKVICAIIKIMDETHLRIGNEKYTEMNHSFGLTTLRRKHVDLLGEDVTLEIMGKSHQKRRVLIHDPEVIEVIKNLVHIPGYEIFKYSDNGTMKHVESGDVNRFLRDLTGKHVCSKDFRTWTGTRYAAEYFLNEEKTNKKKRISKVVKNVSKVLGNTPSVSRGYFTHPKIIRLYEDESIYKARPIMKKEQMLDPTEKIVLSVLRD